MTSLSARAILALSMLNIMLALTWPAAASGQSCDGDCDGNGAVTVDEILTVVQIALGTQPLETCAAADSDSSGTATVDDILRAVAAGLNGCVVVTPTPTASPQPTATEAVDALGTRRFDLDPQASVKRVFDGTTPPVVTRPFAPLRGMSGGVAEDGFLVLDAGVPSRDGVAFVDLVDGSEFLFADATATFGRIVCIAPEYPTERAGIIDCDGGADIGVIQTLDHKPGQLGVEGFTLADCDALGGTVESPHQFCANAEKLGEPCRSAADCNSPSGTPNGVCGVATAMCSRGLEDVTCRDDATCDTGAGLLDGICGVEDPHPGICNAPLRLESLQNGSRPGDVTLAPLILAGRTLSGVPARLSFEQQLPCGDEGEGELILLALTSGTARTSMPNFSVEGFDASLEQTGESFACSGWSGASGGTLVFAIPRLHATANLTDIIYAGSLVGR